MEGWQPIHCWIRLRGVPRNLQRISTSIRLDSCNTVLSIPIGTIPPARCARQAKIAEKIASTPPLSLSFPLPPSPFPPLSLSLPSPLFSPFLRRFIIICVNLRYILELCWFAADQYTYLRVMEECTDEKHRRKGYCETCVPWQTHWPQSVRDSAKAATTVETECP